MRLNNETLQNRTCCFHRGNTRCLRSSDDGTDSNQQSTTYSVGGEVVDGYIYNALVWIDINQNGTLDDGEPNTYSNLDGSYDLELTSEQVDAIVGLPILAELTKDSVDVGPNPDAYSDVETLTQDLESGKLTAVFDEANTAHKITLSMPPLGPAISNRSKPMNPFRVKSLHPLPHVPMSLLLRL